MKQTKLKSVKDLNIKSETMQILYKENALGDWFGGGVLNKRLKSTSKKRTQINQISLNYNVSIEEREHSSKKSDNL